MKIVSVLLLTTKMYLVEYVAAKRGGEKNINIDELRKFGYTGDNIKSGEIGFGSERAFILKPNLSDDRTNHEILNILEKSKHEES